MSFCCPTPPSPGFGRKAINCGPFQALIDRFRRARRDPSLAVLEGFHVLKHALRFGAAVTEIVTCDRQQAQRLTASHAPELTGFPGFAISEVPQAVFRQLSPFAPTTGIMALARRPPAGSALNDVPLRPLVLLENPRSHGNMGAAIRVAAAAGAAGVVTTGEHDPWHPAALTGSAGLHFALPVCRLPKTERLNRLTQGPGGRSRPLVALTPGGEPLKPDRLPDAAILAFGSERGGLTPELLAAASCRLSIPMTSGVSSLNLATAVAVVLYAWRLGQPG